jgi:FkbH-like protein
MKPNRIRRGEFFLNQDSVLRIYKNRKFISTRSGDETFLSKLHFLRNEAWEPYIEHAANIASKVDSKLEFSLSAYDDSLNSLLSRTPYPNFVIWLNWSRIQITSIQTLFDRIKSAREFHLHSNWYLILPSHSAAAARREVLRLAKIQGWDSNQIIDFPELSLTDESIKMGYSRNELDFISFKLGTLVAMETSGSKIRALVVDMDNTLYQGVIGEDELSEIQITPNHLQVQKVITRLSDSGVLVFIATKNNSSEVDLAFDANLLPNLPRSKITSIYGGWGSKSDSLSEILKLLNFSQANVLFIDDNGRELAEIATAFPDVLTVCALNTEHLLLALEESVSFETDKTGSSDTRVKDIQAKIVRSEFNQLGASDAQLLTDLKTKIHSTNVIEIEGLNRANELFSKTNQFNFSLKRSRVTLDQLGLQFGVINSTLKDDISDSGIISSLCWTLESGTARILEFVISCRALGRGTEKYILKSALSVLTTQTVECRVSADFLEGPRNLPSKDFLLAYFQRVPEGWLLDWDKLNKETNDIGREIIE